MLGLFLAYHPIQRHAGRKLFTATTIFGLATIGLGLSTDIYLSLIFLWLIGASDVFSVVIRHTLVQSDTPDSMRGRVAAVNTLFIGASNELGEFESGATAALSPRSTRRCSAMARVSWSRIAPSCQRRSIWCSSRSAS